MSSGNKNTNRNTSSLTKQDHSNPSKNSKQSRKGKFTETATNPFFLFPLIFILCIIPLIVRLKLYHPNLSQYSWFSDNDWQVDIFLYYKQWFFVGITGLMVLIITWKAYKERRNLKFSPIFIPLAIYALLCLLSAIFAKDTSFSFGGSFDQFESVLVQIGYCVVVYYVYLFVNTENDLMRIFKFFIFAVLAMSILGAFQFMGKDLFSSDFGMDLVIPSLYRNDAEVSFNFGANRVYLTLFNPNYVGVYAALVLPLLLILLLFEKKLHKIVLYIVAVIGVIVSLIGSFSLAGLAGFATTVVCILIFMWRYLLKRIYIVIPIVIVLVTTLVILNVKTDNFMVNRIKASVNVQKTEYALSEMETKEDSIYLNYNDNKIYVSFNILEDGTVAFRVVDDKKNEIATNYDPSTDVYYVADERFPGINMAYNKTYANCFYIVVDGQQWNFTNQAGDGKYYYINAFGKPDQMITAKSVLFNDYESFASNRGYIWSRTIPLIKDYILLGAGSDNFVLAFPQQDYLGLVRTGFTSLIMTKPHSMYLQMGVQTGLLSLIAFLVFYGMYFISSVRLYIKGFFHNYYAQVGVAILIGTIGYMITSITNDSSITTAPIFWTMIGLGIAVNHKAKPFVMEERAAMRAKKLEKQTSIRGEEE